MEFGRFLDLKWLPDLIRAYLLQCRLEVAVALGHQK